MGPHLMTIRTTILAMLLPFLASAQTFDDFCAASYQQAASAASFSYTAAGNYYTTNYVENTTNFTALVWTNGGGYVTFSTGRNADVFVLAGGGCGGIYGGGGGGAGGYIFTNGVVTGSNSVSVGPGGLSSTGYVARSYNGSNSIFGALKAYGGGNGASGGGNIDMLATGGGSGGGGGASYTTYVLGGPGTNGQGNAGGNSPGVGGGYTSAGGGGANAAGQTPGSTAANGGAGGAGKTNTITGTARGYAGGGGGAVFDNGGAKTPGVGGAGGGGTGAYCHSDAVGINSPSTPGTANTGGGGGGGGAYGNTGVIQPGGSGIVVVRFATP